MDSRIFIKEANALVNDIKSFQASILMPEDELEQGTVLQRRITNMLSGLQNPSLLAAMSLKDAALGAGFQVDFKKQTMIDEVHKAISRDQRV